MFLMNAFTFGISFLIVRKHMLMLSEKIIPLMLDAMTISRFLLRLFGFFFLEWSGSEKRNFIT
jgi:hypothetical protein